jgi:hypothetical protein
MGYGNKWPLWKRAAADAMFHTNFPHKGVYKIWGEFKHQDKVITVSYVVKVS